MLFVQKNQCAYPFGLISFKIFTAFKWLQVSWLVVKPVSLYSLFAYAYSIGRTAHKMIVDLSYPIESKCMIGKVSLNEKSKNEINM